MANSPPPESNPHPPPGRLEQLLAVLVAELDLCAQARWDDPVVFAWRARRCLEVILLGVLTKHAPQHAASLRNPTIDTFVRHEALKRENHGSPIGKDIFNVIDSVHAFGNTAAHYQFEDVDHEENAVVVARGLARVVEWFHRFLNVPMPPETARLLNAMRDSSHRVPSASQRAVEQLRSEALAREAEHARSERALRGERDEARERLTGQERALLDARAQAAELARAHAEARARVDDLEHQLRDGRVQLASATRGRGFAVLAATTVGLLAGATLTSALRGRPTPRIGSPAPDVAEVIPRVETRRGSASTTPLPVVPSDAAQAPADAAMVAPTCPAGFVLYDVREVTLQPWPQGARRWGAAMHPGRSARYALTPFCLQQRAETVGEIRQFRPSLLVTRPGCARLPGGDAQRATCVLHQEAEAYCAERWQGRLPTVLEWEAAARAVERADAAEVQRWRRVGDDTAEGRRALSELEWVADGFPAAPFDLGAPRPGEWMTRAPIPPEPWPGAYPRHSWNRHGEGRDMYIGFRCATAPR
jgi:hypothetical protein